VEDLSVGSPYYEAPLVQWNGDETDEDINGIIYRFDDEDSDDFD
jgi:hypothetical protein